MYKATTTAVDGFLTGQPDAEFSELCCVAKALVLYNKPIHYIRAVPNHSRWQNTML